MDDVLLDRGLVADQRSYLTLNFVEAIEIDIGLTPQLDRGKPGEQNHPGDQPEQLTADGDLQDGPIGHNERKVRSLRCGGKLVADIGFMKR